MFCSKSLYMFFYPELNGMKFNEVKNMEHGIQPEEYMEYGIQHEEYPEAYMEYGNQHEEDPGYCNELTIIKEGGSIFDSKHGGSDYDVYVKCERQNQAELMSGHTENKYEFPGVLYCMKDEGNMMIYVENDQTDQKVKIWEVIKGPGEKFNAN